MIQGGQNAVANPPDQAETKVSACTTLDQGPLTVSEVALVSSTPTQDVVENSEST